MDKAKVNMIASKILDSVQVEARIKTDPWTKEEWQQYMKDHPNTKKYCPGGSEWGNMKWMTEEDKSTHKNSDEYKKYKKEYEELRKTAIENFKKKYGTTNKGKNKFVNNYIENNLSEESKKFIDYQSDDSVKTEVEDIYKNLPRVVQKEVTKHNRKSYPNNPEYNIFKDDTKLRNLLTDFLGVSEKDAQKEDIASVEYAFKEAINFAKNDKHKFDRKNKKTHNSIKNKLIKHLTDSAMKAEDKGLKGDRIVDIAKRIKGLDDVEFSAFYEHMRFRSSTKPPHNVQNKRSWLLKNSSFGESMYKKLLKSMNEDEIEDLLDNSVKYANQHVGQKRDGYRNIDQLKSDFVNNQILRMRREGRSENSINKYRQLMNGMGKQEFSAFIAWLSEQNDDEDIIIDPKAFNITSKTSSAFNILSRIAAIFDESKAIKEVEEDAGAASTHGNVMMEEVEMVSANDVDKDEYEEPIFADDEDIDDEDIEDEDIEDEDIDDEDIDDEDIEDEDIEDEDIDDEDIDDEEEVPEEIKAGDLKNDKSVILKDAEEEKVDDEESEDEVEESEDKDEESEDEDDASEYADVDPENLKLAGELVAIAEKLFKRHKPMTAKQKKFVSSYMTRVAKKLK
jgi:hypothetical protein